jgi:hypothetical protein
MTEPLPPEVREAAVTALRKALNEGHLITGRADQLAEGIARDAVVAYLHWLLNQHNWHWLPGDAGWLRRQREMYQGGTGRG